MTWEHYVKVLNALGNSGLIETGYAGASINKGYSAVRPPGHPKLNSPKGVEVLMENAKLKRENFKLRQRIEELEQLEKIVKPNYAVSEHTTVGNIVNV